MLSAIKQHRKTEETTLLIVLIVSFIGIAVTNLNPVESYRYWLLTTVFYALAGMVISFSRRRRDKTLGLENPHRFIDQLLLWCGVFFAILSLYILVKIGRINYEAAGFVVLLVLGLGVFIDGIGFSWRFSMIGMLMMLAAVIAAYITAYMWLVLGIVILAAMLAFAIEHLNYRKLIKYYEENGVEE
jgi:hypothetical protein